MSILQRAEKAAADVKSTLSLGVVMAGAALLVAVLALVVALVK